MSLTLNTIAKDKSVDDRWRGFSRPVSARNLANDVEDEVVDALAHSVTSRMPDLTHRYYALKASWMGVDKLNWWDRNAPLPGEDPRQFSWDEARKMVLTAFDEFDPGMAEVAGWFFDRNWIDAPHRPGKASGAEWGDSPGAMAEACELIITCLPSPAASAAVMDEMLPEVKAGAISRGTLFLVATS